MGPAPWSAHPFACGTKPVVASAWIAPIVPDIQVLDLPFLFAIRAVLYKVVDGPADMRKILVEEALAAGRFQRDIIAKSEAGVISARILIMVGAASLLLLANALFLVSGMFIDVFSNILILVPILLGPITAAGINGVHFGIVTSVNVDIGNVAPPFGFNLFIASGTFNKPYLTVLRAVLPWLLIGVEN